MNERKRHNTQTLFSYYVILELSKIASLLLNTLFFWIQSTIDKQRYKMMARWFLSCLTLSFGTGFLFMIGGVMVHHPSPTSVASSSSSSSSSSSAYSSVLDTVGDHRRHPSVGEGGGAVSSSSSSSSFVVAALRMLPPMTTVRRTGSSTATALRLYQRRRPNITIRPAIPTPSATGQRRQLQLQQQPSGDNDSRQNKTNDNQKKKIGGRTTKSYRALALVGVGILPLFFDATVFPVPPALITDALLLLAVGSLFVGTEGSE